MSGLPFGSRNYLIVAQNEAELRPSGGFISAFALLQFKYGVPVNVKMNDVFGAIDDHPFMEPPYPYGDLLADENYKGHSLRDSNVYADFPTSAEEIIKYYQITNPDTEINGVIAVNYAVLEGIISELGEINVEGKAINSQNLFETIEHEINNIDRHDLQSLATRKQFLQPLLKGIIQKSIFYPLLWNELSGAVYRSLISKDIQLYFRDEELEKKFAQKHWTGEWPSNDDGDFLAVVDANLGGMKSNRYITRDINYDVYFEERAPGNVELRAKVDVTITHRGEDYIPISGDYSGFLRLYTPKDSVPTSIPEGGWQYEELGRKVYASKIALKPGESTKVSFEYQLPNKTLQNGEYKLYVPRQSSAEDQYSVAVHAPRGMTLRNLGHCKTCEIRENLFLFRGILRYDGFLHLQLVPDKLSPLVIFQKMLSLESATIHFNEAINLTPDAKFTMRELGFNPSDSDMASVSSFSIDPNNPRVLNLVLQGLTSQPEERYKLSISGIRDIHGNKINPDPTEITLIQRNL